MCPHDAFSDCAAASQKVDVGRETCQPITVSIATPLTRPSLPQTVDFGSRTGYEVGVVTATLSLPGEPSPSTVKVPYGRGGETFTVIVFTLPGEHHHRVRRDDAFNDGIHVESIAESRSACLSSPSIDRREFRLLSGMWSRPANPYRDRSDCLVADLARRYATWQGVYAAGSGRTSRSAVLIGSSTSAILDRNQRRP